jgi:hypothetical protein
MEGTPLLDVLRGLILEPEAQADFRADPSGYMQRFGYDDVPEDDLSEAVGLVADTLPPDVAHAVNTAAAAPADDDSFGEGSVGLLGRISTVEVTESVVPELDDLPPDSGVDDDLDAIEHDSTTFGDVTRDFDDEAADADGDSDTDGDGVRGDEVDDDPQDHDGPADAADDLDGDTGGTQAGGTDLGSFGDDDPAGAEPAGAEPAHATFGDGGEPTTDDVSFGDAGFDDADLGDGPAAADPFDEDLQLDGGDGDPEAFGQGSDAGPDASHERFGSEGSYGSDADDSFDDDSFDEGFDDDSSYSAGVGVDDGSPVAPAPGGGDDLGAPADDDSFGDDDFGGAGTGDDFEGGDEDHDGPDGGELGDDVGLF